MSQGNEILEMEAAKNARNVARRQIALGLGALLVVFASGCARWQGIRPEDLSSFVKSRQPTSIRIALADSIVEVGVPEVVGDSLRGVQRNGGRHRRSFALSSIDSAAVRTETHKGLILAGVSTALIVLVLVSFMNSSIY